MEYIIKTNNDRYWLQYKGDIDEVLDYINNCIWVKCLSDDKRKTLLSPAHIISIEQRIKGEISVINGEPIK